MDKLIHHANLDGRLNVFYSTPSAYTAAKHAYNISWPLKTDDFFPYADCPTCYWTGAVPGCMHVLSPLSYHHYKHLQWRCLCFDMRLHGALVVHKRQSVLPVEAVWHAPDYS